MSKFIAWLGSNKLVVILVLIIGYLFLANRPFTFKQSSLTAGSRNMAAPATMEMGMAADEAVGIIPPYPEPQPDVPPSDRSDRLVITDTNLSLLVKDVSSTLDQILGKTQELGGFLVSSHLNRPEGAASASIVVRVPSAKKDQALDAFKSFSVRTVSESVTGRDVTDQYENIEAKLAVLNTTKAKFEAIQDQAITVEELLKVQRELVNLQSQIDNMVGRQQYLEQSANLTKITIYLSTDELALPYAPDQPWRPQAVFRQAVRSLITSARSAASLAIWAGVYAVIWLPLLLIFVYFTRRGRRSM